MDSLSRSLNNHQEIASEPKKADHLDHHHHHHSSRQLLALCHHHSLTTVRLTCEGDLHEPNFPQKLKKLTSKIKILVSNDKRPIKVTKVEPWNSVRVTFNLPNEAAQRLQQLAEHGDADLRQLGILSIQLEGQQVISLRLSNQNSANSGNNLTCNNIDQVNSSSSSSSSTTTSNRSNSSSSGSNDQNNISLVSASTVREPTPNDNSNKKYPYGQINGAISDESSNGSSSNSCLEPPPHMSSADHRTSTLPPKLHSFHHMGSGHENASSAQSLPPSTPSPSTSSTITLPASNVAPSQPQKVYFSQASTTTNRAGNSLLLSAHQPTNQIGSTGSSQIKASFQTAPTNNNNNNNTSSKVFTDEQNGKAIQKHDSLPSAPSNATQIVVQPAAIQASAPFSSTEANTVTSNVARPFAIAQSAAAFSANIRNTKLIQFNGPRSHHQITSSSTSSPASSPSQQSFISSQKSVPQASLIHSFQSLQMPPVQKPQDGSNSSLLSVVEAVIEPPPTHANIKSLQPPYDHNANYVNSSSSAPSTLPLYQSLSTSAPSQQQQATSNTSAASDRPPPQLQNAASYQPVSSAGPSQQTISSTTSDILGSSVDAVDDEDLLASVTATGAHSIDFNNFTDLNDLNLLSMLEEMETANQVSTATTTASSSTVLDSTTVRHPQGSTSRSESNQLNESCSTVPATVTVTPPVASVPAKIDSFRSPNVIAPQSTQPMPFFLAQQSQQQAPTKVGPSVVSAGGQPVLIKSSTGAVLSPAPQHLSQQIMASTSTATSLAPSTMYPFTSMQHASLFTSKQQGPQPRHVIVPVRHMPPVRAAASQQVPPVPLQQQQQQQSVPMIRAMQPTVTSPSDLLIQQPGPQQALFRPVSGQFVRQQLPPTSNVAATLSGKPQQQQQLQQQAQQIVIRQSVPFPATPQQVASCGNSSSGQQQQQNTVALSSPLLVNLLQSDAQPSTSLPQAVQQQQTAFMTQAGATQQIRLITPPGTHADGTQVMMMVRVSSAPQGTTTQLINHSTLSSIVASMPSSQQVVTSIPSAIFDHQQQPSQQQISVSIPSQANQQQGENLTAAVPAPKPKKPRKSRAKKNLAENAKADGNSIQTSISVTPISQVVSSISPGAITSIPLSLATTNTSRMLTSTSASTILTFPATSSIAQTLKLQTSTGKPQQQTIISGQAGQHLFNQKQRVQPVVMIATTNGNLQLSSVGTPSEGNVTVSNPIVSSAGTFFIANMAAGCLGGGTSATSTSTTTTAGVQLAGNRKQIFLATKSNSFPVSSALSAGGRGNRFGNNSTSSSTPSLNASPVKFVSQAATSQVPICIAVSGNSSPMSLSTLEGSSLPTPSPGKSSLGSNVPVSVQPETSPISTCNLAPSIDSTNSVVSVASNCASSSNVTPIVTSMVLSTPTASTTLVNSPIANKTSFATTALPSTETVTVTSQQQSIITATKSMTQVTSIPIGESMSKVTPVAISTAATNMPANSLLLNKLNQSTASILAASPKIIPAASFVQLSNKTTMKTITLPAASPLLPSIQKPVLSIKVDTNLKEISSLNVISSESPFISRSAEPVVNLISSVSTETKVDTVFPASASAETKKPPISKSLSDKSFKLSSLDDVFETESTTTSKLDLFAEDEPDLSAPISPSYFLAPPSAFENKSSETKESQSQSSAFSLESESKNDTSTDEATSSQSDLSSVLTTNSQKEASQASSSTSTNAVSSSNSAAEAAASLEIAPTSSTSSTVVTGDATKSESTLTTTTSITKSSNEPVQTRSNSYDSLSSYFLAKHNYSQDLPDHILEDDEDGDDSDADMDFGLSIYPKTSRFLSGSIGSIGGTSSLSLSSTSSQNVSMSSPTTTSIAKTSDAHNKTSSSLSNALNLETTSSSKGTASESKPTTSPVHSSAAISDRQSAPVRAIQSEQPVQKMNQPKTQPTHNVSNNKLAEADKLASTPMNIFHSIMNGDVPPNALNSESSELHNPCSPPGSFDTSIVSSAEESKDEASSIGTKPTFQLASIVASKSYPTTSSSITNYSTENIVSGKLDNLFPVDSTKISIAAIENHELHNASLAAGNCKVKIDSVSKPAASRTPRKTSPVTPGNKNRRKTTASSVSSTSQTSIQTTSNILSKSELHSLLASPLPVAKPNITVSNFTTLETDLSSPSDVTAANSAADASNTRPLFITFKPSSQQQTIPSNTSQPQPIKLVQPDSNSSTSSTPTASTPATVVKLLVPGVNIAGSTASKLLTMAAASSGGSIVTSNPNSINSPLVSAVAGTSGQNASEISGNKSQSLQQMLGARYIISGPGGGQFQQIVVVKSPMNNASATNSTQQVKLISAPSSKLTAVSGASTSTSQPFYMVSGASGQTLLSVKPNIQTIPPNDISTTSSPSSINIASEQSSESESESGKTIVRKTSSASAPLIDFQPSSGATDHGTVSLNASHLENPTNTTEEVADSANDRKTPTTSSLMISDQFVKTESVSATMGNSDGHHSNDSAQLNTIVDLSKCNAIHRQRARSKPHLIIGKSESNAVVHISNNHILMPKSVVKSNSDSSVNFITVNSDTNSPASVANVLTNSMVIGKAKSEPVSVVSTPRTVHIMPFPSSSEALVSGNSTISSNSNVVILRADSSKFKEMDKDGYLGLKGTTMSPITKRQIVITKPNLTLHPPTGSSHIQQITTAPEASLSPVFATKSTNAPVTVATKTLPTILRQSKRKADTAFVNQQGFDYSASIPNSDHSYSPDLDSSVASSMIASVNRANKTNLQTVQSNQPTTVMPIIEFVDDSNDNSDIGQTVMPRPRKRARKSNLTTGKQQPSAQTLGTSLLLTEFNQIQPIDVNNHHAQMNDNNNNKPPSSMATTPPARVLRNTASSASKNASAIAANSTNKRTPRTNRNTLMQSVSVPVMAAVTVPTTPAPTVSSYANAEATFVTANSITKSRKPRETLANVNSPRQTRSNRNRSKTAANDLPSGEIGITDNAVDESLCMSPEIEVISMPLENSHLALSALSSDVPIVPPPPMGQVNNFTVTSPPAIDRGMTIMESSNSNSSTASSSSSNSLLVKRPRGKPMPSPITTKPSLRSNSASETLASPMTTANKRRRVAKEINR